MNVKEYLKLKQEIKKEQASGSDTQKITAAEEQGKKVLAAAKNAEAKLKTAQE